MQKDLDLSYETWLADLTSNSVAVSLQNLIDSGLKIPNFQSLESCSLKVDFVEMYQPEESWSGL